LNEKTFDRRRIFIFLMVGLVVLFLYLYFFVDISQMITLIRTVDPIYIVAALIAMNLSVFFFAYTWKILLEIMFIRVSIYKSFLLAWASTFIDLLIPAETVSGEISRAYMLSKSSSVNIGSVVASIISHRMLIMSVTLGGMIAGSFLFLSSQQVQPYMVWFVVVATAISVTYIVGLYAVSINENISRRVVDVIFGFLEFITRGRRSFEKYRRMAEVSLKYFHEGFKTLEKSPFGLIVAILMSLLAWVFDLILIFLVFISLGYPIPLGVVLIVYCFIGALQAMPIALPGVVGIAEIVMTTLYTLLGIPLTVAATATILTRVVSFWFRLFIGYFAFQFSGVKYLAKKNG